MMLETINLRDKDPLVYGFIAGLLGTLGDEVIHWGAVYLGIAGSTTGHYLSQLMFPHQEVTLLRLLLGEFTHLLAGGIFGITIVILLYLTGCRYALLKGLGAGAASWIFHVAIIPNLVIPRPYIYRTFNEALVDLVAHLVWGIIAALFILKTMCADPGEHHQTQGNLCQPQAKPLPPAPDKGIRDNLTHPRQATGLLRTGRLTALGQRLYQIIRRYW